MTLKLSYFECIVFPIICSTLRLVSQSIFINNRRRLTQLQNCDILHLSVSITSFISALIMRLMSLSALFTAGGGEVSSLSVVCTRRAVGSRSLRSLFFFTPHNHLKILAKKQKRMRTFSRGIYSYNWTIGYNYVTPFFFFNNWLEWHILKRFSLGYESK